MTANQIEYWKLQENKRHNLAIEEMDKPVKEAQAYQYYSSGVLNLEKVNTEQTQQALNIAASENQYAQAGLNYAKTQTEYINQNIMQLEYEEREAQHPGVMSEAEYNNRIQEQRVQILDDYPGKAYATAGVINFSEKWGFRSSAVDAISKLGTSLVSLFAR